jgi:DNA-binding response OmpR family regulator
MANIDAATPHRRRFVLASLRASGGAASSRNGLTNGATSGVLGCMRMNWTVSDRILLVRMTAPAEMVSDYLAQSARVSRALINAGLQMQGADSYDIVVLGLMRPHGRADVCRQLRGEAAFDPHADRARRRHGRIVGLEMGADDYLPKPFEPRELLARVRAILRRGRGIAESILRFGRLEIDCDAREVRLNGEPKALTSHQFGILLAMARRAGHVMTREALMDIMRNEPLEAFDRSIDVHISRIRAAIEDDHRRPRRVITIRGAGYVFAKAQD